MLKKPRRDIADFYKKIFSNAIFKNKIQEKAKKVVTKKDLRKLIREEIMPLMKKENLNYSEEDLLEYEEETLKILSKEALADVSGGISVKSALWAGGILSMALFGSLNANAMDVDPTAPTPQETRRSSQQQNNSNNNNNLANDASQHQDSNNGNHAANNLAPQDSNNGSPDYNENTENKNDVSDKHDDGSNNELVDEYNDEDYSVDIDEIMASQIRAFGKNPEMRTLDRNAAIDMANGKIPCICKNANGKIIFVIPIWCDTIEKYSFDVTYYPLDSPKEKEEKSLLKKIANSVEILVVPPNVKEIGRWAFCGWPNLKKIIFIDGWPQLHGYSFRQCSQLRKVESIGDSSNRPDVTSSTSYNPFFGCNNLEEINIADNVKYTTQCSLISNDQKYGEKLKKISMPKQAQIYFSENKGSGAFPEPIPTEELLFPNGSSCKKFEISSWTKLEKLDVQ